MPATRSARTRPRRRAGATTSGSIRFGAGAGGGGAGGRSGTGAGAAATGCVARGGGSGAPSGGPIATTPPQLRHFARFGANDAGIWKRARHDWQTPTRWAIPAEDSALRGRDNGRSGPESQGLGSRP